MINILNIEPFRAYRERLLFCVLSAFNVSVYSRSRYQKNAITGKICAIMRERITPSEASPAGDIHAGREGELVV